jgi:hypothetical protein
MDDKFHRNRKVRELRSSKGGKEALGDWAFWWSWCLDDPELTGIVPFAELKGSELKSAELLVKAGLWDRVDVGYRFHDFDEYNQTIDRIKKKREADRARVAAKRSAGHDEESESVASESQATNLRVASESQVSRPTVASESRLARDPGPARPGPEERESALVEISDLDDSLVWVRLGKFYKSIYDSEQEGTRNPRPYDEQRICSSDSKHFIAICKLVQAEAKRCELGERQVFESAARAFLRDDSQRAKGFKLAFFVCDFLVYVDRSLEVAS